MALRRDDAAASPLTVVVTVVILAALLTVGLYALVFDRPEESLGLVARRDGGGLHFDVAQERGGLEWDELTVRFIDRAGTDLASTHLQVPSGPVDRDDRVQAHPLPPGGTYLLLVLKGDTELVRLAVEV